MGVQGLWKLIEPCGRMVPLETMSHKVLAVDVSIWLHQAMKGMHDAQGAPVAIAHLLVLFHRLCKLLFYKIKPVFVFDGGVPALKRNTMAMRRTQKTAARSEASRVRGRLLKNLLKHEALRHVLSDEAASTMLGLSSLTLPGPNEEEDLYKLPPVATQPSDSNSSGSDEATSDDDSDTPHLDIHSLDLDSNSFKALPAEVRHDILSELQETRKQSSWKHLDEMPSHSQDFSNFQMNRLLKRRAVQVSLESAGKEMGARDVSLQELQGLLGEDFVGGNVQSGRIAQDDVARFMLIQKPKATTVKEAKKKNLIDNSKGFDILEHVEDVQWSDTSDTDSELRDLSDKRSEKLCAAENEFLSIQAVLEEGLASYKVSNDCDVKLESVSQIITSLQNEKSSEELIDSGICVKSELERHQISTENSQIQKMEIDTVELKHENEFVNSIARPTSDLEIADILCILEDNSNASIIKSTLASEESKPMHVEKGSLSEEEEGEKRTFEIKRSDLIETVQCNPNDKERSKTSVDVNMLEEDEVTSKAAELRDNANQILQSYTVETLSLNIARGKQIVGCGEVLANETKCSEKLQIVDFLREPRDSMAANVDTPQMTSSEYDLVQESQAFCPTPGSKLDNSVSTMVVQDYDSVNNPDVSILDKCLVLKNLNPQVDPSSLVDQSKHVHQEKEDTMSDANKERTVDVLIAKEQPLQEQEPSAPADSESDEDLIPVNDTPPRYPSPPAEIRRLSPKQVTQEKMPQTEVELKEYQKTLERERDDLINERGRQERMAQNMTDQMYAEAQELLRLFGVPYIVAPMEAEAQCATLDLLGLTEGTITDDSDIWLFGGQRVYKNFFNQKQRVLEYRCEDIREYFKLSREDMVKLALLVGSDYTSGLPGIGPVTALEVLASFPTPAQSEQMLAGLSKFRDWVASGFLVGPTRSALKNKVKNTSLIPGFPSQAVAEAYLHPDVDTSKESFTWAKPNVSLLQKYTKLKFGWTTERCNELIMPIMKKLMETTDQTTIDRFFRVAPKPSPLEGRVSKRVEGAVKRLGAGSAVLEENDETKPSTSRAKRRKPEGNTETKPVVDALTLRLHEKVKIPQREAQKWKRQEMKRNAAELLKAGRGRGRSTGRGVARPASARKEVKLSESSSDGD